MGRTYANFSTETARLRVSFSSDKHWPIDEFELARGVLEDDDMTVNTLDLPATIDVDVEPGAYITALTPGTVMRVESREELSRASIEALATAFAFAVDQEVTATRESDSLVRVVTSADVEAPQAESTQHPGARLDAAIERMREQPEAQAEQPAPQAERRHDPRIRTAGTPS